MRKTGLAIEGYIFHLMVGNLQVRGGIYRNGTRPFDSKGEDVIVSFLSGRDGWDGFSQSGIVNVNVYVPNIEFGMPYLVKDVSRCEELEEQLLSILETHKTGDFLLETDGTPTTFADGDFNVVNIRVKYRYNRI